MPNYWVNKMSVLYIKAYQTKKVLVTFTSSYSESIGFTWFCLLFPWYGELTQHCIHELLHTS